MKISWFLLVLGLLIIAIWTIPSPEGWKEYLGQIIFYIYSLIGADRLYTLWDKKDKTHTTKKESSK